MQRTIEADATPARAGALFFPNGLLLLAVIIASGLWIMLYVAPEVRRFGPSSPISYSFWDRSTVPSGDAEPGAAPVELGLKVQTRDIGYLSGLRVYLGDEATDGHTVSVWTIDGDELATAELLDEQPAAWNEVRFAEPVRLDAGTTYVVSHFVPSGSYPVAARYFADDETSFRAGTLRPLGHRRKEPNGVYHPGGAGFPDSESRGDNYWIDVLVADRRAIE